MTEKSVAQMRADLRTFYVNKIKPELGTINRLRTGNKYKINPNQDFAALASYLLPLRYFSSYFANESIESIE